MPTKIILLNGPPASGKDTIADYLSDHVDECYWHMIKDRLFKIARSIAIIEKIVWDILNSEPTTDNHFID